MKKSIICLLFIFLLKVGNAQGIDATGTIVNSNGKALPFAFVRDSQNKNATYTDSVGTFHLKVNPSSILLVSSKGYKDAKVDVENKTSFNIILTAGSTAATGNANNAGDGKVFETHLVVVESPGLVMTKTNRDDTHGSPYLFNGWMHGFVVNTNNAIYQDVHYLFNYDKINGGLLMTTDGRSAMEINKNQINGFTLFDQNANPYVFENVPAIDPKHYVEQISSGKKYKIYKVLDTKLVKANYFNNGLAATGNNYDEYVDQSTYYVIKAQAAEPKKLMLKKKAIKEAFADDIDKTNSFMAEQGSKDIDDNYLKKLGEYLNN